MLFLDDGLGGKGTYAEALLSGKYIREDLQNFGVLVAEEKCQWLPSQKFMYDRIRVFRLFKI